MSDVAYPDALPVGYRLHWYVIERVIGQGGFGITHLARDTNLDRRVAIKEYLPSDFARRRTDTMVQPSSESCAERYAWGLERFLAEARTLARFEHPNIVRVHSVFEANNTAYMVMRFEEGENLASRLERCGTLSQRELLDCLLPVLDGLQLVHDAGYIHRDIKPENIYLRRDGSPVLLDFGSARQSFGRGKTMTILVAPGYAPLEQYYGDADTQGPWTDIYGLGATCYRAITGHAPLDAVARAKGVLGSAREILAPATEAGRGRYDDRLLAAVDHALRLSEGERPQSIAEWQRELTGPVTKPVRPAAAAAEAASSPPPDAPPAAAIPIAAPIAAPASHPLRLWGTAAGAAVVAGSAAFLLAGRRPEVAVPPTPAPVTTAPAPALEPVRTIAMEAPPAASSPPARAVVVTPTARPTPDAPRANVLTPTRHVAPAPSKLPAPTPATPSASTPALLGALAPPLAPVVVPAPPAAEPPASSPASPARAVAPPRTPDEERLSAAVQALKGRDFPRAKELLLPLAGAGVVRAQRLLGSAYEGMGAGIPAYEWYGLAARGGDAEAGALKDKVAAKLQPAEVGVAERGIQAWKPGADAALEATR